MNTKKKYIILISMAIGILLCMLDTTIMNITYPAIQKDLGLDLPTIQWALNIYTILFAVFTIPLGRAAEIFGRNKVYIIGLLIFVAGSVISGCSNNAFELIAGRSIQSIGASIIFPTSMVIGINAFKDSERTKVIAVLGVTQGLAAALGPSIGGIVTQYMGWRWVFFINIPLLVLALILCVTSLKLKNEEKLPVKIDFLGSILSMILLLSLTVALTKGNDWGWNNAIVLILFATAIIGFISFIFVEKRVKFPMINMDLFKDRQFNASVFAVIFANLFLIGVNVVLPSFLTKIQSKSELEAAFLITPISAMIFVFSPIAAVLIEKLGPRIVTFIGFIAMFASYILLYTVNISDGNINLILICMLLGFGYGIIIGPITVLAASDFKGELLTASQSVIGVFRQIGTVLAIAIFVTCLTQNIKSEKKVVLDYTKYKSKTVSIDKKYQDKIVLDTKLGLEKEEVNSSSKKNHVTAEERNSIINANYNKTLSIMEKKLGPQINENIKMSIKKEVTKKVDYKIEKNNDKINKVVSNIKVYIKEKMTDAYLRIYKYAAIAVGLASLCAFIFPVRDAYRKKLQNLQK